MTTRLGDEQSRELNGTVSHEVVHLIVLTLEHINGSLEFLKKDWPTWLPSREVTTFIKAYSEIKKLRDELEHAEQHLWFNSPTKPTGAFDGGWVLIRGVRVPHSGDSIRWESGLGPTNVSWLGRKYDLRPSLLALNALAPVLVKAYAGED